MSEQLEKLIVAVSVDLNNMRKELDRAKGMTDSLRRSIETHTRASGDSFRQMENTVKASVTGQANKIEVLKTSYIKMAAVATASFLAIKKAWNMAEAAADLEEQRGALEVLGRQYGQTADQITKAVTEASGAQLNLKEATALATKALQAGFSPQQVAKLVKGAEMIADRTGEDIPAAFEKLARAVKTGQERTIAMYFANLKLTSSLEGEEEAIGETSVQGENYLRLADQIDGMQRQLAGSTDSTADQMTQFKKQLENAGIAADDLALRGLAGLALAMSGIAEIAAIAGRNILQALKAANELRSQGRYLPGNMVTESIGKAYSWATGGKWESPDQIRNRLDRGIAAIDQRGIEIGQDIGLYKGILSGGASSGVSSGGGASNVRATGTDYIRLLAEWKKKKPVTGGGGGRTSTATPADKIGSYLSDLATASSEVGMTDYELGMTRVIAKLKELGATEAQIAQGKAIFAAGYEKKRIFDEMGESAEYAKKATSELAASFVELESKYGMVSAETEAARAEYIKEATGTLPGAFGELEQQFGLNPRESENARNEQIAAKRNETRAMVESLSPFIAYVNQLQKIKDLQDKGIISPEQSAIMEDNAAMVRQAATESMHYNGTIEERARLEQILGYAVKDTAVSGEDAMLAMRDYDQAIGRLELSTPKAITQLGQLSEGFGKALSDWQDSFDVTKDIEKTVGDFANGITDSFFAMIQSGQDFGTSMSGVLKTILADIASMVFQISIVQPLMSGITGALSGAGIVSLPPGKASGGFVQASMPYIVGERGPELFVPGGSGTIIPNDQLAGAGGQSVNVTLNVPAGVSRAELMQILPAYRKATMAAIADANQRGGSFSAALG